MPGRDYRHRRVRSLRATEQVNIFILDAYRQVLMVGQAPAVGHLAVIGACSAVAVAAMLLIMRRYSQFLALRVITS